MQQTVRSALGSGKTFSLSTKSGKRYVIANPRQIEVSSSPHTDHMIVHETRARDGRFEFVFFDQISEVYVEP